VREAAGDDLGRRGTDGGRIGRLSAVTSWFSYFNDDPTNIRNMLAAGGGALYDIGCYSVNLSRMLFGGEPDRVSGAVHRDDASGTDTVTAGILEFADGLSVFGCSTRSEDDQHVDIYGTTGRISIEIPFNIPPDRPTRIMVAAGGDPPVAPAVETIELPTADPYASEAEAFIATVLDGAPHPLPPSDAVANLRVIERLFASAEGPVSGAG
jgi:predicted dehydrogenase